MTDNVEPPFLGFYSYCKKCRMFHIDKIKNSIGDDSFECLSPSEFIEALSFPVYSKRGKFGIRFDFVWPDAFKNYKRYWDITHPRGVKNET